MMVHVKKTNTIYIQALLRRLLLIAVIMPISCPLVSLEVQLVNDKWGDFFARDKVGLSYIASIQRGKCNALDCIEKWPILCSSYIFQGLFPLALLNAHAYTYSISKYLYARTTFKSCKSIYETKSLSYCCPCRLSLLALFSHKPTTFLNSVTSTKTLNWPEVSYEFFCHICTI